MREAIIKHESDQDIDVPAEFTPGERPLLEGQLVNLADEIAYNGHDIDDGLSSGLLTLERLQEVDILRDVFRQVERDVSERTPAMIRFALIRNRVNRMVLDLGGEIRRRLKANDIQSENDVRNCGQRLVAFSSEQDEFNRRLKAFLQEHVYLHPKLERMRAHSREIITVLFDHYLAHPDIISEDFRKRYPGQPLHRFVADYIAGMTDRYAQNEYEKLMTS